MRKMAVVFMFPESEDNLKLPTLVAKAKELFSQMEVMDDVKIHALRGDAAETVGTFLITGEEPEESFLVEYAKRELALAGNDQDFNDCIINAVREFARYGHSGGSAEAGIEILHELLQFNNLTPLTDNAKEWMEVTEGMWQSTRNPEAFSENHGRTYRLLSTGDTMYDSVRAYIPQDGDEQTDKEG